MTSTWLSFLRIVTHLNIPATCSYCKLPALAEGHVFLVLEQFQTPAPSTSHWRPASSHTYLPHKPNSTSTSMHTSCYGLQLKHHLFSWLFSPLPPHSGFSKSDVLQLKIMVFTTVFYASYLFICTTLNCLVAEVNKTISNYKLLLNYCLRRAMKERNMKSGLNYSGCEKLFSLFNFAYAFFFFPLPISWFFHYAVGCWHYSFYINHYFQVLLPFIKATLALLPLSLISSTILSVAT